jgi:hypothetical protein
MNPTTVPFPTAVLPRGEGLQSVFEELARTISSSQAALFSGSFRELDACTRQQQEVCSRIYGLIQSRPPLEESLVRDWASAVRKRNLLLAAALRRMQRHLETLRSLLSGPVSTYGPAPGPAATVGQGV